MGLSAWVLVLAGGEGRRLSGLTRDALGRNVPKQFCDFGTGRSLIGRTLDRALAIVPHDRVVAVVTEAHREWWEGELEVLPAENVVVQPTNRGTAPGILLPLLHIAERDADATLVVLPSDHHVDDESVLARSVEEAVDAADSHPEHVVLLGIVPEHPDPEYGWILPLAMDDGPSHPVAAFVEKPVELEAMRLMARGAVWNSFMFAARADALIGMFDRRLPELLASLRTGHTGTASRGLADLYEGLPPRDFSRSVLASLPERLRVLAVPACGWTDLGTPERLARIAPVADGAGDRSAA